VSAGMALWDRYVVFAAHDAAILADAAGDSVRVASAGASTIGGLAQVAFRLGMASVLVGAEDVGRLAIAAERALDRLAAGALDRATAPSVIAAGIGALHAAVQQLANPDKSGARVEGIPIGDRRAELEALVAGAATVGAGTATTTAPRPRAPGAPPSAGGFAWTPTVDDDMVDLFFDEAGERIEALASKLVEVERRPDDRELLRDVFRDLHTVKGSSAMVGLVPVNQLAHASEDLVGQIRDAGRAVDGPVIDALLATLDALRAMLAQARAGAHVTYDPDPVVARLRNPGAAHDDRPIATAVAGAAAAGATTGPASAAQGPAAAAAAASEQARQTIRVDFDKLDRLLNLVGELVLGRDDLRTAVSALGSVTAELAADQAIARNAGQLRTAGAAAAGAGGGGGAVVTLSPVRANQLRTLGEELGRIERVLGDVGTDLSRGTDRLAAISSALREQVMRLRMVPVGGVFRKHVRTVRDLAAKLGKRARLELVGEDTELDKLLVEALDEPLMHLVRNAVDHGLEGTDARATAGKSPEGVVTLAASHRGNQVEVRISDDGRGLDPARLRARAVDKGLLSPDEAETLDDRAARELIFRAGFSTAATVSEVSGRGVGMDVVRQTIVNRLKGTIEVESTTGQGSAFVLKLPLTLAIIQVLVARAGGETFAIPLDTVARVLAIAPGDIRMIGDREVVEVRGKHLPLIRLEQVLGLDDGMEAGGDVLQLVLTEQGGQLYALACDHLLGKKEIVIKSLGPLLTAVPCVAGATLLGDRCALILDVPAIVRRALAQPSAPRPVRAAGDAAARATAGAPASAQVLLVEDSDIVRESLRRLLVDAGYLVTVAVDGQHGLELAKTKRFDLVSTDVMMPRMDGYELTRALRAMPEYADAPIVMVTSRGERIDRVRGFDAGVDEYITKPHDRQLLLRVVKKLLGHGGGGPGTITGRPDADGPDGGDA
jgi:two-component system chemotaxis sensor kinase CheA